MTGRTRWGTLAALAVVLLLTGCDNRESWPLWINGYSIRAAIAIALIPIVLWGIYKYGGDDHFGGGGE